MVVRVSSCFGNLSNSCFSQFDSKQGWYVSGGKQIEVAGNKAIEANTTIRADGKGHALNPTLRLIVVDFLDKKQTGEFQLQFNQWDVQMRGQIVR